MPAGQEQGRVHANTPHSATAMVHHMMLMRAIGYPTGTVVYLTFLGSVIGA